MTERTPKTCVLCAVSLGESADPRQMYCRPCYNGKRSALRKSIRQRAKERITGDEPWHGTTSGYTNNLCRCVACNQASREYHRAHIQNPGVRERRREMGRISDKQPHRRLQARARRYGITRDVLSALLAPGRCDSCGTTDPGPVGWQIDHDHACCSSKTSACGECVRGVLCPSCNLALGQVNDDLAKLEALVAYLKRWQP